MGFQLNQESSDAHQWAVCGVRTLVVGSDDSGLRQITLFDIAVRPESRVLFLVPAAHDSHLIACNSACDALEACVDSFPNVRVKPGMESFVTRPLHHDEGAVSAEDRSDCSLSIKQTQTPPQLSDPLKLMLSDITFKGSTSVYTINMENRSEHIVRYGFRFEGPRPSADTLSLMPLALPCDPSGGTYQWDNYDRAYYGRFDHRVFTIDVCRDDGGKTPTEQYKNMRLRHASGSLTNIVPAKLTLSELSQRLLPALGVAVELHDPYSASASGSSASDACTDDSDDDNSTVNVIRCKRIVATHPVRNTVLRCGDIPPEED
ncbi:MAG: hypothetical protein MHM6MM_008567 [Cercozoa sp. M6MM]